MADKNTPAGAASFVAKIVKDPKNPPATLMLTGFLGASSESEHTRLYFDANLSSYVEIPNDAILHTQDTAAEDGLGGSYVWIKRDAQLTYGAAAPQRAKGTFLEGPIMQDHMAGAAAVTPGVAFPVTLPPVCGGISLPHVCQITPYCPPSVRPCISQPVICNWPLRTVAPPCLPQTLPPQCVVSAVGPCPTLAGCPSGFACQGGGGDPFARMGQPGGGAAPQAFHFPPTLTLGGPCRTSPVFCGGGEQTLVQGVQTQWAYCTWFVCPPPTPPGTATMQAGVPTGWPGCSQVCHPSFLGMGCGTGGTLQMMAISQQCTNNVIDCPRVTPDCPR